MTEQLPTNQVSLGDLKRAIEAVPPNPRMVSLVSHLGDLTQYEIAHAEAWRAAFEWHCQLIERHAALSEKVGACIADWAAIEREEEEGMAIIREKLR